MTAGSVYETDSLDAAFNLGTSLAREGKLVEAADAFRRADELGDAAGASNLGVLLEQRGDPVGAEAAYRRADERGDAMGAFLLGALLEQRGDLTGAKDAYQRGDQRDSLVAAADVPQAVRSGHRAKRARRAYLFCVGLLALAGVIALAVGAVPGMHHATIRHSPPARPTTAVSAPVSSPASVSPEPAPPVDRPTVVGHRVAQTKRPRRPSVARIATRRQSSAGSRSGGDHRGGVTESSRRATTPASAGSHSGGPSVGGETVGSSPSPSGSSRTTPSTPTAGSTGSQPRGRSGGVGIEAGTGTTSGGG